MKYYSLIVRGGNGVWFPEFGDYDKQVVADEKADMMDRGIHRTDVAIIMTEDSQDAIMAGVRKYNQ